VRHFLGLSLSALVLALVLAPISQADPTYTSDPVLADFTSGMTYATVIADFTGDAGTTPPYTPTSADVAAGLRFYANGSSTPVIVEFADATSFIRVFPNIDHADQAYDGYQYAILGSNDNSTYTPLFDALTVTGAGPDFKLGTFTGTAPLTVNNVLTPGAGPAGTVGFIADFNFSSAYKFYEFVPSTEATSANPEPEFSAIGTTNVPEPGSLLLLATGLVGLSARKWRLFSR